MPSLAYRLKDALYLNITNRCPCDCSFCLRGTWDTIGDADSLWLDHEPNANEVIEAIKVAMGCEQTVGVMSSSPACDEALTSPQSGELSEIVYCGFGEPFSSYEVMLDVARWLKAQVPTPRIRVNTNGLGDLINGRPTAPELEGLVDALSISLNAPTPEEYVQLCNPVFGLDALPAIISFAKQAKRYVSEVTFTVVSILTPEQLEACRAVAAEAGIPLRIREQV